MKKNLPVFETAILFILLLTLFVSAWLFLYGSQIIPSIGSFY